MSVHDLASDQPPATIPFADAFEDVVRNAHADLNLEGLSNEARSSLDRHLGSRLSAACGPALLREFQSFKSAGADWLSLFLAGQTDGAPSHRYRAFIAWLQQGGWEEFFRRYPVARNFQTTLIQDWRVSSSQLAGRARTDMSGHGKVERLETGLSDPHNGGCSVSLLFFEDGTSAIYKPRSVGLERCLSDLICWLDQRLEVPDVKWYAPWVIPRDGYGWMEHIEPRPCRDENDVQKFYRSAGGLLALLYLLGATDCHCENVIAHGRFPVLIDAETLLQPRYVPWPPANHIEALDPIGWDTIARTGYLPRWEVVDGGRFAADVSGMAGGTEFASAPGPNWSCVNTDRMNLSEGPVPAKASSNLAFLNGQKLEPGFWTRAVESGFEETWAALGRLGNELPLQNFARQSTRFVFRPTQLYANLLWQSTQPEHLVCEQSQGVVFEPLRKSLESIDASPAEHCILQKELESLRRRDIPFFTVDCDSTEIDGQSLRLAGSAWANLCERVHAWNQGSLRRQKSIVRGSLRAHVARPAPFVEKALPFPDSKPVENGFLLSAAERIADQIVEASFETKTGRGWVGLEACGSSDRYQLEALGLDLYSGNGGIAVFLAAAARIFGRAEFGRIAKEALAPVRQFTNSDSFRQSYEFAKQMGSGAACGVGSLIYSLATSGRLLGDEDSLKHARGVAALLHTEIISADRQFDVISGAAGAILALLALYSCLPDDEMLDKARECGEHLIAMRSGVEGQRAWRNFARLPLTGFAHGAAGIGIALLKLARATGISEFRDAGMEAFAYERGLFDSVYSNWPDLRDNAMSGGQPGFSTSWCHGAPGIGFSRLMAMERESPCALEVAAAVEATRGHGIMGPDYVCCGNFGRVEFILESGSRLKSSNLIDEARSVAGWLCQRAEAAGGFRILSATNDDGFKPGFFRGSAGIGYTLLRCAAPNQLPCVLALE